MAITLIVKKIPRPDSIPSKHKNFPPLSGLKLDMMENKNKLKPNVPKVVIESDHPNINRRSNSDEDLYRPPKTNKFKNIHSHSIERKPKLSKPQEIEDDELVIDLNEPDDDDDLFNSIGINNKPRNSKHNSDKISTHADARSDRSYASTKSDRSDYQPNDYIMNDDEISNHSIGNYSNGNHSVNDFGSDGSDLDDGDYDTENDSVEMVEETEDPNDPYAGLSSEEKEKLKKKEYKWRYHMINQQYKNDPEIKMPIYLESKSVEELEEDYEDVMRQISLKENVENYRQYLIGSWMVMEYIGTQIIGIDLMGFTEAQTKAMNKYERLLIELGAKRSDSWQSNWPVEIRLIALTLFQAVIFFLGKILADKNPNMVSMFNTFTGQNISSHEPKNTTENTQTTTQTTEKPKGRKMRGPSVQM